MSGIPLWEQALTILMWMVAATIGGLVLVMLLRLIGKKRSVTIPTPAGPLEIGSEVGGVEVEAATQQNGVVPAIPPSGKQGNPHITCPNLKDVIIVFRNRDDLKDHIARIKEESRAKVTRIETHELPKEIMQSAEDTIARVIGMMESGYLTLLKEQGIAKSEVAATEQFKLYRIIVKAIQPHLILESRRMMKENGWIKKETDGTFNTYVSRKTEDFLSTVTDLLNDYYVIEAPTRSELYSFMMTKVRQPNGILETVAETIRGFLVIAKNWRKEIEKINTETDEQVEILQRRMEKEMSEILGGEC